MFFYSWVGYFTLLIYSGWDSPHLFSWIRGGHLGWWVYVTRNQRRNRRDIQRGPGIKRSRCIESPGNLCETKLPHRFLFVWEQWAVALIFRMKSWKCWSDGSLKSHSTLVMYCSIYSCPTFQLSKSHVGVSKNRDTPKWTVYNGKPY